MPTGEGGDDSVPSRTRAFLKLLGFAVAFALVLAAALLALAFFGFLAAPSPFGLIIFAYLLYRWTREGRKSVGDDRGAAPPR